MKRLLLTQIMAAGLLSGANNLNNHGGRTMQNQVKAYLIFWTPSGVALDPSATDGVGNFKSLEERFFNDLSASSYFNIDTQYPGQCGTNQCVVQNGPGASRLGGSWVDTQAYPNSKGSRANPLQDADIQAEVTRAISQNHWTVDGNSEFFVFTGVFKASGAEVEECDSSGSSCTFNAFCAYHGNFTSGGQDVLYGMLSDAAFNGAGCSEGIANAVNGQIASDQQVALMTHEFTETVTDPDGDAWWDSSTGSEIGDNCNQIAAIVTMNGNKYAVQQEWSNDTASCVSAFGPSIQFNISTGSDDLRADSSATAALQKLGASTTFETVNLKAQNDPPWNVNSGHIAVAGFNQSSQTALGQVVVRLTSHNSGNETSDNWNIQKVTAQVLSPAGAVLCTQSAAGNPLARLTGTVPTTLIASPNCQPAASSAALFNQITFDIGTGADNLRSDSSATATINGKSFTLKPQGESAWDNDSAHTKAFSLTPALTLAEFGDISISLQSHNSFTETNDNWDIQNVRITLSGTGGSTCLVNQNGNPLLRLTGSAATLVLHPRAGC